VLADRKDYIFHPFVIIESALFLNRWRVSSARPVATIADAKVERKGRNIAKAKLRALDRKIEINRAALSLRH